MQEDDEVDERKPGAPARVRTPTALEREDHYNSGHARYRNWSPHCVAAKGQGQAHKAIGGDKAAITFTLATSTTQACPASR